MAAHPTTQSGSPHAELTFSEKLEIQHGWTREFTLRVIDEYRRFVYLACISDEELTPSDEVDQAWHLHLTYTRDYWGGFCEDVLRRPLHHGPTEGGPVEEQRYERNYEYTLALYQKVFRDVPPNDIWPPISIRFGFADDMVRVNRRLFRIVPKRTWSAATASMLYFSVLPFFASASIVLVALDIVSMPYAIGIVIVFWVIAKHYLQEYEGMVVGPIFAKGSEVIHQKQHEHRISYKVARQRGDVVAVRVKRIPQQNLDRRRTQWGFSFCGGGSGCSGGGGGCGRGGGAAASLSSRLHFDAACGTQ